MKRSELSINSLVHFLILYVFTIVSMGIVLGVRVFANTVGLSEEKMVLDVATGGLIVILFLSLLIGSAWFGRRKVTRWGLGANGFGFAFCLAMTAFFPAFFVLWAGAETHSSCSKKELMPAFRLFCPLIPVIGSGLIFFWIAHSSIRVESAVGGAFGTFGFMMIFFGWLLLQHVERKVSLPKARIHNR